MIRRLCRIAAVCTITIAGLVAVSSSPSAAAEPDAVGWWSRQLPFQDDTRAEAQVTGQSVGGPVRFGTAAGPAQIDPGAPVTTIPPPIQPPQLPTPPITTPDPGEGSPNPSVPDGGMWVANDATGPQAVSAIRFRGDIGSADLTLRFAPGSTTVGRMIACPIISGWTAGGEGAWRDRPADDCDRLAIGGNLSPDGTSIVFSLPQGFNEFGDRILDISLRPALGSGDVFNVYFEAPDSDSLQVFAGQAPPPPEDTLPEPPPEQLPTTIPPATPTPTGGSTFTPIDDAPTPTFTEVDDVASPTVDLTGGGAPVPAPVANALEPFTESRAGRIISVIALLLLGMGLWYAGSAPGRAPRLLGGLAAGNADLPVEVVTVDSGRGIGRFRRDRSEPPIKF